MVDKQQVGRTEQISLFVAIGEIINSVRSRCMCAVCQMRSVDQRSNARKSIIIGEQGASVVRPGECKEYFRRTCRAHVLAETCVLKVCILWSPSTGLNHITFANYSMVTHAGASQSAHV